MTRQLHLRGATNPPTPGTKYTCRMSSVNRGGNLTFRFSPDPNAINIAPSAQVQTVPSRGGQVSYATTKQIGPMEITGNLRSRWDLFELADFVQRSMSEAIYGGAPLRFVYPERDLDYDIYIMSLTPGVALDSSQAELVEYSITAAIVGQNSDVNKVELSRLADIELPMENVGWIDAKNAARIAWRRVGEYAQISPPDEGGGNGGADRPDGGTRGAAPPEERDVSNGGNNGGSGNGGDNGSPTNISRGPIGNPGFYGDVWNNRPSWNSVKDFFNNNPWELKR